MTFAVAPQIHPFSFDETINSGDVVSLTCFVSKGDLPLNISWTLNGQNIVNMDGVVTGSMNRRNSILSVESVQAYHTGEYTCVAENIAGVTKYSSYLNVNGTAQIFPIFVEL